MSDEEPRFDFSEGAGETLGSLPCFTTVPTRGAAAATLEAALEPIHRLVYGRGGKAGSRRRALEDFKGFPASMQADVEEKMGKLVKDRLRSIVKALGVPVLISSKHGEVATAVAAFLMAPKDEGKVKIAAAKKVPKKATTRTAPAKRTRASTEKKDEAAAETPAQPAPKKAKGESTSTTHATAAAASAAEPSDDAVRVEVYRRVLAMSFEERAVLGVKALRTKLEVHFHLADGGLKSKKDVITSTASDCVRALREAEDHAAASAQSAKAQEGETVGSHTETAATASSAAEEAKAAPAAPAAPASSTPPQALHTAPMHPGVLPQ